MSEEKQNTGLPVSPSVIPDGAQGTGSRDAGIQAPPWTPGPWSAQWDDNGYWYIEPLGITGHGLRGDSGECRERANARLLAAAPELYAELLCVRETFLELGILDEAHPITRSIDRALSKARGEDAPAIQSPTPQQESKKGTEGGQ